jgi:hypothetical protein
MNAKKIAECALLIYDCQNQLDDPDRTGIVLDNECLSNEITDISLNAIIREMTQQIQNEVNE